ncbi:MAG: 2-amino-4-hydroxy-6-hydroxymethyldihydropteridine diphosphokinase [Nitrospirae bacterium]|nr:MAG: 2-amino-4-hydroxy-6-hydroxymethyldihydropteridine diphosphokinase [Nitrospirota bacterium]
MAQRAFIGLGSNLSEPEYQIQSAFIELARLPHTRLTARSSLYRSAPVGYADQPDFINAVAWLETTLAPLQLLQALFDLEHRFGRERTFRNAPRILDLDLLLYDGLICHEHGLTLPHPRMHKRAFVLAPLLEIAPDCAIPGRGAAYPWLKTCAGQTVERLEPPQELLRA